MTQVVSAAAAAAAAGRMIENFPLLVEFQYLPL